MLRWTAELDGLRRKLTKLLSPEAKAVAVEWQVLPQSLKLTLARPIRIHTRMRIAQGAAVCSQSGIDMAPTVSW